MNIIFGVVVALAVFCKVSTEFFIDSGDDRLLMISLGWLMFFTGIAAGMVY